MHYAHFNMLMYLILILSKSNGTHAYKVKLVDYVENSK